MHEPFCLVATRLYGRAIAGDLETFDLNLALNRKRPVRPQLPLDQVIRKEPLENKRQHRLGWRFRQFAYLKLDIGSMTSGEPARGSCQWVTLARRISFVNPHFRV